MRCSRSFRVHHFRGFDSLREKANPPIDPPQPTLAMLTIGVFSANTLASLSNHLGQLPAKASLGDQY